MRKLRVVATAMALLGFGWLHPATSADAFEDTQPPTTPTNLRAIDVTASSVTLAWDPSSDDSGTVQYRIMQGLYAHGSTVDGTEKFIYGFPGNSTRSFRVRAEDPSGNVSPWSDSITVTTDPPDTTPPSAPTNLRVTGTTSSTVSLAWDASADNEGGEGIQGYWVQNVGVTTHGTGDTEYTWPVLSPGTYRFTVVAYDRAYPTGNKSAPSNEVTVTIE